MESESPSIEIRRLTELEDLRRVEELQKSVWGFEPLDVVPARLMRVASRSGTLVLGAFDGAGDLVGFAYGFPGIREGEAMFCSHMLAVRPGVRNRSLGFRLKCAQKAALLPGKVNLVTWTYDPLEVKNGYLNLTKLGARVGEYLENLYGVTSSPLHGALPTDRFVVQWEIRSERVRERTEGEFDAAAYSRDRLAELRPDRSVNDTRPGPDGLRLCGVVRLDRDERELLVEVPKDAALLRTRYVAEGLVWQEAIRSIFQGYFARGYLLTEVLRSPDGERSFYLLER